MESHKLAQPGAWLLFEDFVFPGRDLWRTLHSCTLFPFVCLVFSSEGAPQTQGTSEALEEMWLTASLLPCSSPCWDPLSSFLKRINLSVHRLNFHDHQGPHESVLMHSGKAVASCGSMLWSLESMPGCNSDALRSL